MLNIRICFWSYRERLEKIIGDSGSNRLLIWNNAKLQHHQLPQTPYQEGMHSSHPLSALHILVHWGLKCSISPPCEPHSLPLTNTAILTQPVFFDVLGVQL